MQRSTTIKRILKALGAFSLVVVIMVLALVVLNYRALLKAQRFYDSVAIGESRETVLSRAESRRATVVLNTTGSSALILFHGFVYDYSVCRVDFENQQVSAKEFRGLRD